MDTLTANGLILAAMFGAVANHWVWSKTVFRTATKWGFGVR